MRKAKPRKSVAPQDPRSELDQLLTGLLVLALQHAQAIPSPGEPPSPEHERLADEYCLLFAQTMQVQPPSPAVAAALIPRIRAARVFGSVVQCSLAQQAALGDASANEAALLKLLLVTFWHTTLKPRWLAGAFEEKPTSS
jgi:hypothetical protein